METIVKLHKSPIAPRKMRLVADLVRGLTAKQAFYVLGNVSKKCAIQLEKLLLSGLASWQEKNQLKELDQTQLYIKSIQVDSAVMLKRINPAPQGRAHRIRKRFNHVTMVIDNVNSYKLEKGVDKQPSVDINSNNQLKNTHGTKS